MMSKKRSYREGDWFAVPLKDGGYALGLIARASNNSGTLMGYFFAPRMENIPSIEYVQNLSPAAAIDVCMFGDLGLIRGEWPVIYRPEIWNPDDWPMVSFGHIDVVDSNKAYRREYDEKGLNHIIREVSIDPDEANKLPTDGLWGHSALQIKLSKILPAKKT